MGTTYCFTDLHGMYNLWAQIRDYCKPDDTLIFLGDACDRGNDGLKIIYELLKDPRVTYLKGNHEDILAMVGAEICEGRYENKSFWSMNGGDPTIKIFETMDFISQEWLIRKMNNLPQSMWYTNPKGQEIFLCHAGTQIEYSERELQLRGRGSDPYLWDRKHIYFDWPLAAEYLNKYVVHGHTPVQYLFKNMNMEEIYVYADGHKFDLDIGSFESCKIALFNLDTLEVEKYFYDEKTFKETCI